MTKAFEKFLEQSHKQGREYGDGFAPSHFAGLTPDEEHQVLDLLMQRARLGDGVAINGLAQLGTNRAHEELLILAEHLRAPSIGHVAVCEALFQMTGASEWQDKITQDVNADDEFTQRRALWTLECTSSPKSSKHIYDLFIEWLSISRDENLRSTAVGGLIQILGFPPFAEDQSSERIALERKLFNSTGTAIEAALSEARAVYERR